jgi:hypothetical protein
MTGGRQARRDPADRDAIDRGQLGTGMMSDDTGDTMDITKTPSAAEQGAETGSDLKTELEKVDKSNLKR